MVSFVKKEALHDRKLKLIRDLRIYSRIESQISTPKPSQKEDSVELQFMVRDTGIGISERQQSQLFQFCRQSDPEEINQQ